MPDRAVISVHARPETADRLARLSEATRRSRSWLANEAIERYLAEEEAFLAAIEEGRAEVAAGEGLSSEEAKAELRNRLKRRLGGEASAES